MIIISHDRAFLDKNEDKKVDKTTEESESPPKLPEEVEVKEEKK